jgi:hypothetical protein
MQLLLQDLGGLLKVCAPMDQLSIRPNQDVGRNGADGIPREDIALVTGPTAEVRLNN